VSADILAAPEKELRQKPSDKQKPSGAVPDVTGDAALFSSSSARWRAAYAIGSTTAAAMF